MKKFDKEYSTQYTPEKEFLMKNGIRPSFVKVINEVTTFKYEKTPALFRALLEFYSSHITDNTRGEEYAIDKRNKCET